MIILMLIPSVRAEPETELMDEVGFDSLVSASMETSGLDVRAIAERLMTGELGLDADTVGKGLRRFGEAMRRGLLDALWALSAPVLASLAAKAMLGEKGDLAIALLCRAGCISLLMGRFFEAREICAATLDSTLRLTNTAAPVLASAMTIAGSAQRAAILTPSTALCAGLIETLLRDMALPLCTVAAAVAASANLSRRFRLNRLFDLLRDTLNRGIRLMLSGFVGLMAIQGLLAGGTDALSARAIRRAIQSALPIIGGEVSDSAGALLASAVAVRSVTGVAGVLALAAASARPILRLAVAAFSLQLASAALEPVSDQDMARIIGHFSDLMRMLLAICAGATLLAILTLGACLAISTL